MNLQCHLFEDVRSELYSLSQCVCVRERVCERELWCDYVWLCMFVCVLLWGRKGAVGRKVRKKRDTEVANLFFCNVFGFLFSSAHSLYCMFCHFHNIYAYFLSCILRPDDTVDRTCKTHINYHTCICIRTAYFFREGRASIFSTFKECRNISL